MDEHPRRLEREHVCEVYSQIAEHFSDTRYKPWPKIAEFLREQPTGSLIADVGCGNGKYLGVSPQTYTIGSDICPELVAIGRSRQYEVAVCDCLNLPYRTDQFDAVICIAVVHHLSTEERRLQALRELARILRPGGRMLVYVWAMEQNKKKFASQDVLVPWHLQPKYTVSGQPQGIPREKNKPKKWRTRKQKKCSRGERAGRSGAAPKRDEEGRPRGEEELLGEGDDVGLLGELTGLSLSGEEGEEERPLALSRGSPPAPGRRPEDEANRPSPSVDRLCGINYSRTETAVESNSQEMPTASQLTSDVQSTSTGMRSGDLESVATPDSSIPPPGSSPHPPSLSQQGYQTFQRYYHVFRQGELSDLVGRLPNMSVVEEYFDHENWCVLAEKSV